MKIHLAISVATLLVCFLLCAGCSTPRSNADVVETSKQNEQKKVGKTVPSSDRDKLQIRGAVKKLEIIPSYSGLKDVYVFNESGNILEQTSVYNNDGRINTKTNNQYDKMGRKISAEYYKDGNLIVKSIFKHDVNGRIFEEIRYNSQGEETGKTIHKYDETGNLSKVINKIIKPDPGLFGMLALQAGEYKQVFSYDENGNQIGVASYMPNSDKLIDKGTFVFNQQKQKIEETTVSPDYGIEAPRIFKNFYTYNQNSDVKEYRSYESITESNVKTVRDRFEVIDNKNTVQNGYLISDKPGMILWTATIYEYEYDSHGNWTKQTSYTQVRSSEKPAQDKIIERNIQYF